MDYYSVTLLPECITGTGLNQRHAKPNGLLDVPGFYPETPQFFCITPHRAIFRETDHITFRVTDVIQRRVSRCPCFDEAGTSLARILRDAGGISRPEKSLRKQLVSASL